jgi:hypothetical protein
MHPDPKPGLIGWDVALSVALLAVAAAAWVVSSITGFFMVAFIDYCPPDRCNADNALASIVVAAAIAGVIGIAASVVSVVRIIRRRPAWPFALGALAISILVEALGFVGYFAFVG